MLLYIHIDIYLNMHKCDYRPLLPSYERRSFEMENHEQSAGVERMDNLELS